MQVLQRDIVLFRTLVWIEAAHGYNGNCYVLQGPLCCWPAAPVRASQQRIQRSGMSFMCCLTRGERGPWRRTGLFRAVNIATYESQR